MKLPKPSHSRELSPQETLALQKQLAYQFVSQKRLGRVTTVAGINVVQQDDIAQLYMYIQEFHAGRKHHESPAGQNHLLHGTSEQALR